MTEPHAAACRDTLPTETPVGETVPGLLACLRTSQVFSLMDGAWRSLVARLLWEQEVPSSNLGAPTILKKGRVP